MTGPPRLTQVNFIVGDLAASIRFYRQIGWAVGEVGRGHAVAELPEGIRVELDTAEFAAVWDSGSHGDTGGSTVLGLSTDTRDAVDDLYAALVGQGHRGRQPPYDTLGVFS